MHNLANYDGHHIMEHIGPWCQANNAKITPIPLSSERYMSFKVKVKLDDYEIVTIKFMDSFRFLSASLEALVESMMDEQDQEAHEHFKCTLEHMTRENIEHSHLPLFLRKGVCPYDWYDSFEKRDVPQLPSQDDFYNYLTNSRLANKDYEHALKFWNVARCNKFGDYVDAYMALDVHLLADVFEWFREKTVKEFGLDPLYNDSLPGLSWDCFLRHSKAAMELPPKLNMHHFLEEAKRGGISMTTRRHAQANNPMMGDDYDPSIPMSFLEYQDCTSMYAYAMQQPLPVSDWEWREPTDFGDNTEKQITSLKCMVDKNPEVGFILRVEVEYPDHLHDAHNDLPFLPERVTLTHEMLSPYCQEQLHTIRNTDKYKETKLVPNLNKKKEYVVHYRELFCALEQGLKVTDVQEVLQFKQKPVMKEIIDFCIEMRKKAKTKVEKDFWKLMCNAVYGKTIENVRNRQNVKIICGVENRYKLMRCIRKPTYVDDIHINEHMAIVIQKRLKVTLNKPIGMGVAILGISKAHIYGYYYNVVKPWFGNACNMLYMDTDSLILHMQVPSIDRFMEYKRDTSYHMDFSGYRSLPSSHPYHCVQNNNKGIPGTFKDELNGDIMTEFVGLGPKLYAYKYMQWNDGKELEERRAKGVSKHITKHTLMFDHYKKAYQEQVCYRVPMQSIQSKLHQLMCISTMKVGLSPLDTKRFYLDDGNHSYAYGHYQIKNLMT